MLCFHVYTFIPFHMLPFCYLLFVWHPRPRGFVLVWISFCMFCVYGEVHDIYDVVDFYERLVPLCIQQLVNGWHVGVLNVWHEYGSHSFFVELICGASRPLIWGRFLNDLIAGIKCFHETLKVFSTKGNLSIMTIINWKIISRPLVEQQSSFLHFV